MWGVVITLDWCPKCSSWILSNQTPTQVFV